MQLINAYVLPPGSCMCCGGNALPAVDLERDLNLGAHDGRAYICGVCVGEAKSLIDSVNGVPGLVARHKWVDAEDRAQRAEAEATDLRDALKVMRGESEFAGVLMKLAKAMTAVYESQNPPPAPPEAAPDPATVPADDAPAGEAEPFPAPDAAAEVPGDPDVAPAKTTKGSKAK